MVRWSSSIRSSSRSRFHNRIKLSIFHGFGENKIMCSTEPSPGASGYASCIYPHYYKTSPSTISLMLNVAWRGTWKTTTASNLNIRKYSNFIEFTRLNLPWVLRDENAVKNTIDTGEGSAVKIVSEKKRKKKLFCDSDTSASHESLYLLSLCWISDISRPVYSLFHSGKVYSLLPRLVECEVRIHKNELESSWYLRNTDERSEPFGKKQILFIKKQRGPFL